MAGSDGRYQFDNVPLFYGTNLFKMELYGPQGQVREDTRKVTVGGEMTPPGQTLMRAYVGQPGERTLAPLLPSSSSINDPGVAFSYQLDHGVSKTLSTTAYVSRAPVSSLAGSALALSAGLGAQADVGMATVQGDVAMQDSGGYAFDLGAITEVKSVSLSATYAMFDRFLSAAASDGLEPLSSVATLRALTSVAHSPLGPLAFQASSQYETYVDGHDELTSGFDVRHHIGQVYVDHGLDLVRTGYDNGAPTTLSLVYNAALSAFLNPYWVHAGARVNLTSGEPIETLSASVLRRFANDATGSISVSYSPPTNDTELDLNYSREFSFATLSGQASVSSQSGLAVGIGMSFSFGMDRRKKPFVTSQQIAENGAIAPFVYHDVNANGRYDPGTDEPLADVAFHGGSSDRKTKTDAGGDAMLTGPVGRRAGGRRRRPDEPQGSVLGLRERARWSSIPGPARSRPSTSPSSMAARSRAPCWRSPTPGPSAASRCSSSAATGASSARSTPSATAPTSSRRLPPGGYRVEIVSGQQINGVNIPVLARSAHLAPGGTEVDGIDFTVDIGDRKPAADDQDGGDQGTGDAGAAPADGSASAGPRFEEADPQ